jgi:hypothetical protein
MKARLGGYAGWQLRDFVFERAAAITLIGALLVWTVHESLNEGSARLIAAGGRNAFAFGGRAMGQHLGLIWFIGALIAVHGISANDRTTGRYRFLFAKPVSVLRFYAQAFALHGAGFMVCNVICLAALTRLVPISGATMESALIVLLTSYVLVGGVGFLFSAIWRFDWIATVATYGVMLYLAAKFPGAAWMQILPPFWKISQQIELIRTLDPIEGKPLLAVAAYGVACFLLGLIILKRRPLAT